MTTNTRKIKINFPGIHHIGRELGFETELNHLEKQVLLDISNQNTENYKIHVFI